MNRLTYHVNIAISFVMVLGLFFKFGSTFGQQCIPAPSGMISWWPGDNNAFDIVDNNHGVLQGGVTFGTGHILQAFEFNGIDGNVLVSDAVNLKASPEMTVVAWVKLGNVNRCGFVNKHRQFVNNDNSWTLRSAGDISPAFDDRKVFMHFLGAPATVKLFIDGVAETNPSTNGLNVGQWHLLAATVKTTDGSLIGNNSLPLGLGYLELNYNDNNPRLFLNGNVDEVQIYNRVLSDMEISNIYNAGNAGVCKIPAFTHNCFEPPLNSTPVTVKNNKCIPCKIILLNQYGIPVTDQDIVAFPVIQIHYNPISGSAVDVTADALSAGEGTEGNQFAYDGTQWHYNLKTGNFTAPGTYTISIVSGDTNEYKIVSTCSASFVVK